MSSSSEVFLLRKSSSSGYLLLRKPPPPDTSGGIPPASVKATSDLDQQSSMTTTSTGSMHIHIGSQSLDQDSMELQSLGQRTAGAAQQPSDTALHPQGTITEDDQAALQSLDRRFTDKERRLPMAARTQSLDRRFGGTDERLSTTGPSHLWSMVKAHDCGVNSQSLHERFTYKRDSSALSGSAALPHSGTLDNGGSGHSLVTADRLPSFVTARQDDDGLHASPSHGTGTDDACHWTMEQATLSSITASAGSQLTITDYKNTTDMEASTQGDGTFGEVPFSTSFKELGLVTLGWSLDLNEPDRPAPLNFNSIELRLSSPSASAEGGSSTGHPSTEDPGGRKLVGGGSQMDCGNGQGHSVICSEPTGDRFTDM